MIGERSNPVGSGQSESALPQDVADRVALQRQQQSPRQRRCSTERPPNSDGSGHAQSDPENDTMRDHVIHFHGFRAKTATEFMEILDEAGVKTDQIDVYVHPGDDVDDATDDG